MTNESDPAVDTIKPSNVASGTHFFNQRYLFAFATRADVLHHLRTQAANEESKRTAEIVLQWESQQQRVQNLIRFESGMADSTRVSEIPRGHEDQIQAYSDDPLFQKTFSQLPVSFSMVQIDRLIAPQRAVNLDYVDRLISSYSKSPALPELLEICLAPHRKMDPIQHLEVGPNTHVFSSPNSDIRFLGAFVKDVTHDDLQYAEGGGLPATAIIAFVGYGAAPINVLRAGSRIILNNGFHRVYALRLLGIQDIPVVIQDIRNPQLEFPGAVAGIPAGYLLGHARPVLMKDFFDPEFAITLRVRERIKMVGIGINLNQHEVPS